MTLQEIKDKRIQLEYEISQRVKWFEQETECTVTGVKFTRTTEEAFGTAKQVTTDVAAELTVEVPV